jgi:hypothetical protein
MPLTKRRTSKRKVVKRKSKKIGGKRKSSSRRASVAPKRRSSDPYAYSPQSSSPSLADELLSSVGMNALSTVGPMAVSYALSQGGRIIKSYRESKTKAKDLADATAVVKGNPIFTKASDNIKNGILLFVVQSKDPYAYLKVKPTDSQLYIDLVAKKQKLFAQKPVKDLIDSAVTYIKIKRSNEKNISDLKNLIL